MNNLRYKVIEYANDLFDFYQIRLEDVEEITKKSFKVKDDTGKSFFLKETTPNVYNKYQFLQSQGINNVLYPLPNRVKEYVTRNKTHTFYLNEYYYDLNIITETKAQNLFNELNQLHRFTGYKRQLNPTTSRPKFEEITRRLDYKFTMLENYVRSIESKPLNIYSMPILSNYQYILDAKKELVRLQKRIISTIKAKESIEYSFIHNHPELNHLININGANYLTSLDKGKIGIDSLDFAKFYVENEDLNIDLPTMIKENYQNINPFYYDYFRYMVLIIYLNRLNVANDEYANAQAFINITESIKKYFNNFTDLRSVDEDEN